MMQHVAGRRILALVAALAFVAAGSALAQDTTDVGRAAIDTTQPAGGAIDTAGADTSAIGDTTDTSGVQNPPGYRGMEQDTTTVPPDRGAGDSVSADTTGGSVSTDTTPNQSDGYHPKPPDAADSGVGDTAGTADSSQ